MYASVGYTEGMFIDDWLREAAEKIARAGIGTARLDTLVLLEDVTGRDRAWLLAHGEYELSPSETAKLEKLLKRRARHEPLAYVRKKSEFYGREFVITHAVLEPRPESETMVDRLKTLPHLPKNVKIADVGAGSGALGVTAKLELPRAGVELLEIDPAALKIAQINVEKYTTDVQAIRSNLLSRSRQDNNVLLCNLPYVPDSHKVNEAALHEPKLAIFGGSDGLDVYRKLFEQVKRLQKQPLFILTESLPPQHADLAGIAADASYKLTVTDDFIQVFELAG
jgi:release factor glutamine methyltransferase